MNNVTIIAILARIACGGLSKLFQAIAAKVENPADLSFYAPKERIQSIFDWLKDNVEGQDIAKTQALEAALKRIFTEAEWARMVDEFDCVVSLDHAVEWLNFRAIDQAHLMEKARKELEEDQEVAKDSWDDKKVKTKIATQARKAHLTAQRRRQQSLKRLTRQLTRLISRNGQRDPLGTLPQVAELMKAKFREFADLVFVGDTGRGWSPLANVEMATTNGWGSISPWKLHGDDILALSAADARADHGTCHGKGYDDSLAHDRISKESGVSPLADYLANNESFICRVQLADGTETRLNALLWDRWNSLLPETKEGIDSTIADARVRAAKNIRGWVTKGRDWATLIHDFKLGAFEKKNVAKLATYGLNTIQQQMAIYG